MAQPRTLAVWLAGLDADGLAALLSRRPDVLLGSPASTLAELAARLAHPDSLVAAARALPRPGLQVLEALQALGERRTLPALTALLAGDDEAGRAAVTRMLEELGTAALAWPGNDERIEIPATLGELLSSPLGLDPPLRQLWRERTADEVNRALRALSRRPGSRKAESLEILLAALAEPEVVAAVVARAPQPVADELHRLAWEDGDDDPFEQYDPVVHRRSAEARRWGVQHGLLVGSHWDYDVRMPAEIALALRGAAYRAPFDWSRPVASGQEMAAGVVASAAGAAVSQLAQHALALLDRLARTPVPRLATGGIGARELGRLSKELGIEDPALRLLLELAAAGGLVEATQEAVRTTATFGAWRAAEPADRMTALLTSWWRFPGVPTESRDADGKALRVLRRRVPCEGCAASRVALLHALGSLAGGAVPAAEAGTLALWLRPLVHVAPQDADVPLATVWREAELLGAIAAGALSPLGAALLDDDEERLRTTLTGMLPESSHRASFGSDLTALVAGSPSAAISALLDSCADRESSGGATTWRFRPASVRRALDDGVPAGELLDRLAAVSARELPQPLRFLIEDVARRHGSLRVAPAVSLISSEDRALLAEVVADRRLAMLGLELLAPTVAGCVVPLDTALARLRDAGYFPVPSSPPAKERARADDDPAARAAASPTLLRDLVRSSRPPRAPAPAGPEPSELARRLLAAGVTEAAEPRSSLAGDLLRLGGRLSVGEAEQLAHAIETGGRVRVEYRARSGAVTRRVISDPELAGAVLYAWCELRQDERVFTVSRILSVAPAG